MADKDTPISTSLEIHLTCLQGIRDASDCDNATRSELIRALTHIARAIDCARRNESN